MFEPGTYDILAEKINSLFLLCHNMDIRLKSLESNFERAHSLPISEEGICSTEAKAYKICSRCGAKVEE